MEEVKRRLKEEKNAKDEDVLVSLQLVNEMLVRGYEFLPIELGKSRAKLYVVEDGKVRLPFCALKGWAAPPRTRWKRLPSTAKNISRWRSCNRHPASAAAFWTACVRWVLCGRSCRRAVR